MCIMQSRRVPRGQAAIGGFRMRCFQKRPYLILAVGLKMLAGRLFSNVLRCRGILRFGTAEEPWLEK